MLRNVVMSPFPAAGNFVSKLAATFRIIVEEPGSQFRRPSYSSIRRPGHL